MVLSISHLFRQISSQAGKGPPGPHHIPPVNCQGTTKSPAYRQIDGQVFPRHCLFQPEIADELYLYLVAAFTTSLLKNILAQVKLDHFQMG